MAFFPHADRNKWTKNGLTDSNLIFISQNVQKEFQDVSRELESERYRAERLEEQVNDLTELHQVYFFVTDRLDLSTYICIPKTLKF